MITEDMQNMPNGRLFNALPVPCSRQFFFSFLMVVRWFFKLFLVPDPLENGAQDGAQDGIDFESIFDRFLNHFGSVLGSILVLTWLHVGVFLDVLAFCAALVATNMRLGVSWCCLGASSCILSASWGPYCAKVARRKLRKAKTLKKQRKNKVF